MNMFENVHDWAEIANMLAAVATISFHIFSRVMLHRNGVGEQIIKNIRKLVEDVKKEAEAVRQGSPNS